MRHSQAPRPHVALAAMHEEFFWCRHCGTWTGTAYWRFEGHWHIRCVKCDRYIAIVTDDEYTTGRETGQEEKTA